MTTVNYSKWIQIKRSKGKKYRSKVQKTPGADFELSSPPGICMGMLNSPSTHVGQYLGSAATQENSSLDAQGFVRICHTGTWSYCRTDPRYSVSNPPPQIICYHKLSGLTGAGGLESPAYESTLIRQNIPRVQTIHLLEVAEVLPGICLLEFKITGKMSFGEKNM